MNKIPLLLFALVLVVSEQGVRVEAQEALKKRVQHHKMKQKQKKQNNNGSQGAQQQEERGEWMAGAWKNGKTFSLLAKNCRALDKDLTETQSTLSDIMTQEQQRDTTSRRQKQQLKKQLKFTKLAYCLKCASETSAAGVTCEDGETADAYCANLMQTRAKLSVQLQNLERLAMEGNSRPWKTTLVTNQRNKVDTQIEALCGSAPFS